MDPGLMSETPPDLTLGDSDNALFTLTVISRYKEARNPLIIQARYNIP